MLFLCVMQAGIKKLLYVNNVSCVVGVLCCLVICELIVYDGVQYFGTQWDLLLTFSII